MNESLKKIRKEILEKLGNDKRYFVIEKAINDLVENQDLELTTFDDAVISYILNKIQEFEKKEAKKKVN